MATILQTKFLNDFFNESYCILGVNNLAKPSAGEKPLHIPVLQMGLPGPLLLKWFNFNPSMDK